VDQRSRQYPALNETKFCLSIILEPPIADPLDVVVWGLGEKNSRLPDL